MNEMVLDPRRWHGSTPPNYTEVFRWRQTTLLKLVSSPTDPKTGRQPVIDAMLAWYAEHPKEFINHWCDTVDPRNAGGDEGKIANMPLIMFPKQEELIDFLEAIRIAQANGLAEKSRDMGATWVACAYSAWLWRFHKDSSVGWGSRKKEYVDVLGNMDSIFEKIRHIIRSWPRIFWPEGFSPDQHFNSMRIINPDNGASITGEIGDDIGRGGRKLIYFKDESAHYEHPDSIEAALSLNTRCQVDISSVNGLGNVFYRKRKAGQIWERGRAPVKDRANIIIMDWADNPLHSKEWYDQMKAEKESAGLAHVFEQEVNRNYGAAVAGIIIPAHYVRACMDAHLKIPGMETGAWRGAIDPADPTEGGGDGHAAGAVKGSVLKVADHWHDGDVGDATRKAVGMFRPFGAIQVMYDAPGVGAGVKSEANRLKGLPGDNPERMPVGITFVAWNGGFGVLNPKEHMDPLDPRSPLNEDHFLNLKAQAWWAMRRRCEKTYLMIEKGHKYPPEELFSIDTKALGPRLTSQLEEELSQPVRKNSTATTKLVVDKKPAGTKSPNLADMAVMDMFPVPAEGYDLQAAM